MTALWQSIELRKRPGLVLAHEPAVAGRIGLQDRRKPPPDALFSSVESQTRASEQPHPPVEPQRAGAPAVRCRQRPRANLRSLRRN